MLSGPYFFKRNWHLFLGYVMERLKTWVVFFHIRWFRKKTDTPLIFTASFCVSLLCMRAELCPTLCDPMDHSPPGSSVHGTLQARILEWVAIPPPGDLPNPGNLRLLYLPALTAAIGYRGRQEVLARRPTGAEAAASTAVTVSGLGVGSVPLWSNSRTRFGEKIWFFTFQMLFIWLKKCNKVRRCV